MRYNVILFDLDNTIIDFDYSEKSALKQTFLTFNVEYKRSYLTYFHTVNDELWKMLEKGLIDRPLLIKTRFQKLFDKFNIANIDPIEFNAEYINNLAKGRKVIKGASQTIKTAFKMGAKCYFITNGLESVQKNRLKNQPFSNCILGICVSEKVGAKKPEKAFFEKAEELFNIKFDEKTLIVGDSLTSDIQGGINARIDTCYVNRKKTVNSLGITPTYEVCDIKEVLDIIK